jgi:hypothetical protein
MSIGGAQLGSARVICGVGGRGGGVGGEARGMLSWSSVTWSLSEQVVMGEIVA